MNIIDTNPVRTSKNSVVVTYQIEDNKYFTIEWNNIHPGTGEVMSQYDWEDVKSSDVELACIVQMTLKEGENDINPHLDLYLQIRDDFNAMDIIEHCTVNSVEIADYDESENIEDATISVEFSTDDKVDVQLAGGEYKSGLGCLIFINGEELICGEDEQLSYMEDAAIAAAETFVRSELTEKFIKKSLPFNCAINNQSYYLRVNQEDGSASIIREPHHHNDYDVSVEVLKTFEQEEQAWVYIKSFSTSEYHDFQGLNNMLQGL